ncbi:hypothetical protein CAPTEDRAFT_187766 [Capitella teleta]|uniref:Nucleotide-diphospho-sugar transferase domain-containing protein n=1 Tax=Capitella teleta TaxID=283909 RepID=R7V2T4_CAPTE|nr:hypothetical protein CAPTEDRAFT_187766 [Capitella teleta]|eukprot:ELU12787.1 hypothetical protein CAPTEDRAFT_187766 [Capitella teleta]
MKVLKKTCFYVTALCLKRWCLISFLCSFILTLWIRFNAFTDPVGPPVLMAGESDLPVLTLLTNMQVINSWNHLDDTEWTLFNITADKKVKLPVAPEYRMDVSRLEDVFTQYDSSFFAWISPDFVFNSGLVETLQKVEPLVPDDESLVVFGRNSMSSNPSIGIRYAIIGNARLFPWNSAFQSCSSPMTPQCILTTCYRHNISGIDASATIETRDLIESAESAIEATDLLDHFSRYESQISGDGRVVVTRKKTDPNYDPRIPSILPPMIPDEEPILVLCTTFRPEHYKKRVYINVLRNWAQFVPHIIPVLFVVEKEPELIKLAVQLGWTVLDAPERNANNIPYLKSMLRTLTSKFQSSFYAYSNGDILFTSDLFYTLLNIKKVRMGPSLVIGQRYNFPLYGRNVFTSNKVRKLVQKESELFLKNAEDYFIFSKDTSLWNDLENVVIGRPGYDNYVVSEFLKSGTVTVIDATETLTALHQTDADGNFAGKSSSGSNYNFDVIGRSYCFTRGKTDLAPYRTFYNGQRINIEERSGFWWRIKNILADIGIH